MSYELIVATGDVSDGGTDEKVEFSLVYTSGSSEYESTRLRPGHGGGDNYRRGHCDIYPTLDFGDVDPEKIVAINVYFYGKKWRLEEVWLTHENTGRTYHNRPNISLGSKNTSSLPYRCAMNTRSSECDITQTQFTLKVRTASNDDAGTNGKVWCKIFDDNGYSSQISRPWSGVDNAFKPGTIDTARLDTGTIVMTSNIISVLFIREGGTNWRVDWFSAKGSAPKAEEVTIQVDAELNDDHHWASANADDIMRTIRGPVRSRIQSRL